MTTMRLIPILTLLTCTSIVAQPGHTTDDRPRITVTGEAVVTAVPDRIVLTLGLETLDPDIARARNDNTDLLKRVRAVARETGIGDRDVQTDQLAIEPRYRDGYTRENFIGYVVRNTVILTLRDVARAEDLVTRLLLAGVTTIHGIDFQTSDYRMHRDTARVLALRAAREKAVAMAAALDRHIGAPLLISENASASSWWYSSAWSWWGGRGVPGMNQNVLQAAPGPAAEPVESMALGRISIRASVDVSFELVP